ncbi:MAG: transketolase [Paludibacteraceae bacterium]|nr:transketolase [Paludibacteraceae bacterium]
MPKTKKTVNTTKKLSDKRVNIVAKITNNKSSETKSKNNTSNTTTHANSSTRQTAIRAANKDIFELQLIAMKLRELVIETLLLAESGHSAGSLSAADILTALYFNLLNINPHNPKDPNRDRFVLSNGHICPVFYAALYTKGYITKNQLYSLRKFNSKAQGHPIYGTLPGIENSSGSLGQGLSQAIGMALAAKLDQRLYRVYCLTGDGELQEGQTWEAAMFAPNYNLNNLTWIIDRNNIQIDGYTESVMPLENLRDKLEAFNWYVLEIDGHNIEEIINSCNMAKSITQRPAVIIAHTVPGKDVDFMEYKFEWHGKPPNKKEAKLALKQLRTLEGKIRY